MFTFICSNDVRKALFQTNANLILKCIAKKSLVTVPYKLLKYGDFFSEEVVSCF